MSAAADRMASTAIIPEKEEKDVGLGLTLPLYVSGSSSVGWWGMLITMLGDITAFISIVFGYFFYWTARPDFVPERAGGPGVWWPAIGLGITAAAWLCVVLARRWNRLDRSVLFHGAIGASVQSRAISRLCGHERDQMASSLPLNRLHGWQGCFSTLLCGW